MEIPEFLRGFPHPQYGSCGGAGKDCSVRRDELDPLDKLFFDHDNDLHDANGDQNKRLEADRKLRAGLLALTDEDFKKIPVFQIKPPFFRRWYAKKYCKMASKIF